MICIKLFSLVEPHFEHLGALFDGSLSKPGHLAPVAGHLGNVESVNVLHGLTKQEMFFAYKSAERA